jgi:hypothetical protein
MLLNEFGALFQAAGALDDARESYRESLAIARMLVAGEPGSSDRQRDLAFVLDRLSELVPATEARELLLEALAILEALERDEKLLPEDQAWLWQVREKIAGAGGLQGARP